MAKITPMMQQYLAIKREYQETILFYRMGDFYEMFYEDAVTASRILGLTLTTRDRKKENAVPMCGIPFHSASGYVARLVNAGYKVAICEQGDPAASTNGLVPREVVQVVTPGLMLDDDHLQQEKANYLMAVCRDRRQDLYGIAFLDITTGDFRVCEVTGHQDFTSEIGRVGPSEVLANDPDLVPAGLFVTHREVPVTVDRGTYLLSTHFGTLGVDGLGLKDHDQAIVAAGMILSYVQETKQGVLAHINRLRTYNPGRYMILGANTTRNLELFDSIAGNETGTLFHVLNQTVTAMGSRRLADWTSFPLLDVEEIGARLDAVESLVGDRDRVRELRELLRDVPDMERIIGRISGNRATPRDVAALAEGLEQVPAVSELVDDLQAGELVEVYASLDSLPAVSGRIRQILVPDPPVKLGDGNVIATGVDAELDELRELRRDSRQWIARLEAQEKETTGIGSLKIGYNKVFGYYLEVTKTHADKVPEHYIRKQTLTNAERYITPELKEYEVKLLGAQDAIAAIEQRLFGELREFLVGQIPDLQQTISALARLDALASLGWVALNGGYTRPAVALDREIRIVKGRHPVVERVLKPGEFVPNSLNFEGDKDTLHVITGPNMAGKSTFMRQVALITIMAQMGSFVPAHEAHIGVVDRIFTRIGALDNLSAGQSTFLVEMSETADILNNATSRSLVILDEIGRGTSTYDGMSLAWAVAEYLDERQVRTFFATHYHELADLARRHKGIKNFHMAVEDSGHEVIFLRELKRGAVGESYGIHVARLAGIPEEVVQNARVILARIGKKGKNIPRGGDLAPVQENLFAAATPVSRDGGEDGKLLAEIKALDLEQLKPIDALNYLYELKGRIKAGDAQG